MSGCLSPLRAKPALNCPYSRARDLSSRARTAAPGFSRPVSKRGPSAIFVTLLIGGSEVIEHPGNAGSLAAMRSLLWVELGWGSV